MRRRTPPLAALLAVILLAAACSGGRTEVATPGSAPPTIVPIPTPPAASIEPTATPTPTPTPTPSPTAEPETAEVQRRLSELGYYVGTVDGESGPATASAVQAFQKVHGLGADGVIGPNTLAALADPVEPTLVGGPPTRVEVDLDRQVLHLVEGGVVTRILPISSGSGESYSSADGGTAESVTPVGTFTVERRISGERHAPLGTLYDPMYFHRGWAIHGSNSVPAYPASHGCVRVTRSDAKWLFDRVGVGMTVVLHGDLNSFDPAAGETAGTAVPAGDTPDTTPPDGIQTEEPTPGPTPATPAPDAVPSPEPAPEPAQPVTPPAEPGPGTPPGDPSTTPTPAPDPAE